MNLTFIGIGHMGFPMVDRLLDAGTSVTIYNRTKEKALPLLNKGAHWVASPKEGASRCDILATMVSNDQALEQLLTEDGILDALPQGAIHLSFSTLSVNLAKSLLSRHTARGHGFVSSPVFGRPDAVSEGRLRLLCAGENAVVERVMPILKALGPEIFHVGEEPFVANLIKISGNFLIASTLEMLGEAFALVRKAGVDPSLFLDIVNSSIFHSPLVENYGKIMAGRHFEKAGFTMDLGLKDICLALEAAAELRAPLPFGGIVKDSLLSGLSHGREALDWSGIVLSHYERAGLDGEHG